MRGEPSSRLLLHGGLLMPAKGWSLPAADETKPRHPEEPGPRTTWNTTRTGLSKKSVNASKHIQSKRGSGNERTNSCKESLGQLPRAALHVTRGGAQSRDPHKRTGGANAKIEAECDGSNVARRTQTIQWTEHRATIEPQTQKSQPTTGGAK